MKNNNNTWVLWWQKHTCIYTSEDLEKVLLWWTSKVMIERRIKWWGNYVVKVLIPGNGVDPWRRRSWSSPTAFPFWGVPKGCEVLSVIMVSVSWPGWGPCLFGFVHSPHFLRGKRGSICEHQQHARQIFHPCSKSLLLWFHLKETSFPSQWVKSGPPFPALGVAQVPLLLKALYTLRPARLTPPPWGPPVLAASNTHSALKLENSVSTRGPWVPHLPYAERPTEVTCPNVIGYQGQSQDGIRSLGTMDMCAFLCRWALMKQEIHKSHFPILFSEAEWIWELLVA